MRGDLGLRMWGAVRGFSFLGGCGWAFKASIFNGRPTRRLQWGIQVFLGSPRAAAPLARGPDPPLLLC
jgi:hypothetical protein